MECKKGKPLFPREKNGHVDLGDPIRSQNSDTGTVCPRCHYSALVESISAVVCGECDYVVIDYWGGLSVESADALSA